MKKKWSNIYLFLIIIGIVLITLTFLYKPVTTGNATGDYQDRVALGGLIVSYLFEGNVLNEIGKDSLIIDSATDNHGIMKETFAWTRTENMNTAPNKKFWPLTKNFCVASVKNSELIMSVKTKGNCFYTRANAVNFQKGFTYETRLKANIAHPVRIVSVNQGKFASNLWLSPGKACLNKNQTCRNLDLTKYHTYRVTIQDRTAKLWIDNFYIGSASTTNAASGNFIRFGNIDKALSTNTITINYFKYYNQSDDAPLTYQKGRNGNSASFDGISDYVTIPGRILDKRSRLSISIWVKIRSFTNSSIISISNPTATRTTEFGLFTTQNRKIQFELDSASGTNIIETPILNTNTWYHIAGTYDGSKMKLYTNGILSDSRARTGSLLNLNTLELNIGANSMKTELFNGEIDELDVYNRTLNESEVRSIYSGNCNVQISGNNFDLDQDNINASLGRAYLCYNRDIYSCKEYPEDFTNHNAINLQQIGSWQCDMTTETWISINPRFTRASSSCSYGSNCGPFVIYSPEKGNFFYELWWDYYLNNGSVVSYCANSPENTNCNIDVNNPNRKVQISSNDGSAEVSQIISTESKEIVNKVVLRVTNKKDNQKSKYTEQTIPITYTCTNECSYIGQTQCNGTVLSKRKVCGSYNASNPCLTWGPLGDCEDGKVCLSSLCRYTTDIDTCTNVNGICLNSILTNTIQLTETCPANGYNCYKCNQSKGYTWDPLFLSCIRTNCTNTCIPNGGKCKNNPLGNSSVNSSLDCCDTGDCYKCNANYHLDNSNNDSCVSNMCSGDLPTTAGQNSTLIGPNNFTLGSAQSWHYSGNNTLYPCQWKCASGYRKITNETFNGCIEGLAPCETDAGCKNETIANAIIIEGNCSSGFQCYQCNLGYNWMNNTCMSSCPNGCIYEGLCLTQGFRAINNSNNKKIYCFNSTMQEQKQEETACSQGYECISNYCKNGSCTSLLSEVSKTRASTERLICWIRKLFGSSETCS